MDEDYDDISYFDEGDDRENWEAEQVFQDECAERREDFDDEDEDEPFEDEFDDADVPYDAMHEAEMRAEYAMECALGFGE